MLGYLEPLSIIALSIILMDGLTTAKFIDASSLFEVIVNKVLL